MSYVFKAYLLSALMRQHMAPFMAEPNPEDMLFLNVLIEAGKVAPVVDKVYPLRREITPAVISRLAHLSRQGMTCIKFLSCPTRGVAISSKLK